MTKDAATTIQEKILRPKQVGTALGLSAKTVRRLLQQGKLQGAKVGHSWFVTLDALEEHLGLDRGKGRETAK